MTYRNRYFLHAFVSCTLLLSLATSLAGKQRRSSADGRYTATAYSVSGKTASGIHTHRHVVAADPDILPIGSVIKIKHAGRYSGEYVVADTGEKIVGPKLDIYIPSVHEAKKFGRRHVTVSVVRLGDGTHESAKEASTQVTKDVRRDIARGAVGNAATEIDWAEAIRPRR